MVQVYAIAPQGLLGKALKSLCGFGKTKNLAPIIPKRYIASYDDSGITGHKLSYILEKGTYSFLAGNSIRDTEVIFEFDIDDIVVIEKLTEEVLNNSKVTIGAYQGSAINICEYILRTPVYNREIYNVDELEGLLKKFVLEGNETITKTIDWYVEDAGIIEGNEIFTLKGYLNLVKLSVKELGDYDLSLICRASENEPELGQIPLTIILDKEIFGTITVVGAQKERKTY